MSAFACRATLVRVDALEHIAAVAIVFGAALVFAAMAWASQHQT
jgi:hypothetical protein